MVHFLNKLLDDKFNHSLTFVTKEICENCDFLSITLVNSFQFLSLPTLFILQQVCTCDHFNDIPFNIKMKFQNESTVMYWKQPCTLLQLINKKSSYSLGMLKYILWILIDWQGSLPQKSSFLPTSPYFTTCYIDGELIKTLTHFQGQAHGPFYYF